VRKTGLVGTLGTMLFVLVGCGGGGGTEPPPDDEIASVSVEVDAGVAIEDGTPTIEVGETADFDATARDASGDLVTTSFTWSSLDPVVATVDADGTATGESPGTARIVARAPNGVRDTAMLAVKDSVGETAVVTVTPARDTVRVGSQVSFEAVAEDADGDTVETAIAWSSRNTAVATVDADGSATGVSPGEAEIVAEAENGVSDTATLVVRDTVGDEPDDDPPTAEILEPADGAAFSEGESITFRGEASDPDEGSLPDDDLVWESDVDGELGRGAEIQASLSAGSHVVSFTATDSAGQPRGVLASGTTDANAVVRNAGGAAGAYRLELRNGATVLASAEREGLGAGEEDTVALPGVGPFSAGTHQLTLDVDTEDAVAESDEGDNSAGARLESYPSGYGIELQFVGSVPEQFRSEVRTERDRWASVITGDLEDITSDSIPIADCFSDSTGLAPRTTPIDDMLMLVRLDSIDGTGGTLAQAGPCFIRADNADPGLPPLPVVGVATFDTADVANLRTQGTLDDVILHEMGHVLGFGGLWDFQGQDGTGPFELIDGKGGSDPRFTGPFAIDRYHAVGGTDAEVPVENTGEVGTRDAHWRETEFDDELMTGFINFGANPLSAVTIGSFGDMYYAVDLGEADAYSIGGAAAVRASGAGTEIGEEVLTPLFGVDPGSGRIWRLDGRPLRPVGGGER